MPHYHFGKLYFTFQPRFLRGGSALADNYISSDKYYHGGEHPPRMLYVYGLGRRDFSGCLPVDLNCRGKTRTYSLAGIEDADKITQLIVSCITNLNPMLLAPNSRAKA